MTWHTFIAVQPVRNTFTFTSALKFNYNVSYHNPLIYIAIHFFVLLFDHWHIYCIYLYKQIRYCYDSIIYK